MYGRRRGGGRGFRNNNNNSSNGFVSRVSPDGPMRGGFNNSGYRNFDRGIGRGRGRYFQSPQPLHKEVMFMEAGRLAAEYLVAKGMLPTIALPSKIQDGGVRKEVGELQELSQLDGEYGGVQLESRTPAHARLGSFDRGSDRKQYSNDCGTSGCKDNMKVAIEKGSFNNYDSDPVHENVKSDSMSGRSKASSDKEADDDALSVHRDEHLATKDDDQNVKVVELAQKNDGTENSPSEAVADTHQLVNDLARIDCYDMTNMEGDKESDGFGNINVKDEEMKESKNEEVTGQHSPIEDSVIQPSHVASYPTSQKGNELLQLCNFAKVPTRTRSLRSKGLKGNDCTTVEEENISAGTSADLAVAISIDSDVIERSVVNPLIEQTPPIEERISTLSPVVTENLVDDDDTVIGLSEYNAVLDQNLDLTTIKLTSMNDSYPSCGEATLLNHEGSAIGSKSLESLYFPAGSFAYLDESSRGKQDSNCPGSSYEFVARDRGEKLVLDESEGGTFKKLKSWHPSMINQVDEYPRLPNVSTGGSTVIERHLPKNNLMMIPNGSSSCHFGFTALGNNNSFEYAEDKQMIDSSYKICDLNLMEGSHMGDCYNGSQMMFFPSMSGTIADPLSVNGGLTIGDNNNLSRQYSTVGTCGKEVQVINLDDDFVDNGVFNPGEKRESIYSGLERFPGQPQGNSDQDGYGRMMSDLLGNEIPNCSTVAGGINSLHSDMRIHNGQGMLPEDDPIYLTLGEIPISMSGFWEPPNPEFGKHF